MILGDVNFGPVDDPFVIAEAGVNHNGSPDLAHDLVAAAAAAGADAVKFQTFEPAQLVADDAVAAPYQAATGAQNQRHMLEGLCLPVTVWKELADHAAERSMMFLSTAFDDASLDTIVELGVPLLKVPSGELTNLPFIERMATRELPLLISTGLGTLDEVRAAVLAASNAPGLGLFQCVTSYPAADEASNLRAIATMAEAFDLPVGWSDHTSGWFSAVGALAVGATFFEKHLTLDRGLSGPDHAASEDPEGFTEYVDRLRAMTACLGDGVKKPHDSELENMAAARRSWHTVRALTKGHSIEAADVRLVRPAIGLAPTEAPVGRQLNKPLAPDVAITRDDLS